MKRKKYLLLFIISFCILISKPYALTIRETMDEFDEYSTIEEGSIVIGATRFSPDNIITASKAAEAGVNDAMLHVLRTGTTEGYQTPKVYYYVDSYVGWFYIDSENQVQTVTDEEELENLSKLDIYYVDNQEKVLEVDYPHDDIKEDTLPKGVIYKDKKLYINATIEKVEFKTIDEKKVSYLMDKTTSSFIEDIRSCFTVNNNKITDYDPSCGNDLIIPTEINGITITSIGPNAFKNTNLVNVVIPNTITSIGDNAFANNNLEKVIIKDKYSQEEFTNYGNNIFGEFNNVIYDNILTRILNNLDNDYVIKYYKNFDINVFLDKNDDGYTLGGYIVNSLIKKVENNGYSKKYEYCGDSCDYFERLELDEVKKLYGISIEKIDELKYKVSIQNYDNNKINKTSKIIDVSVKESGIKSNNDIVTEAMNNLELYNRFDYLLGNGIRHTRNKNIQDIEDIYNIDIILSRLGGGTLDWENHEMISDNWATRTYYLKDDVLYQHEVLEVIGKTNSYLPNEIVNDYENIDIYIEHILNLFEEKSNVTNYEIQINDDGSIYKENNSYLNYDTAITYQIKIYDKTYLEDWSIYFFDYYEDQYDENGYTKASCFEFNNGTITDYDGTCGINVRIPNAINGMDVLEIGNNVFSSMQLNSIRLPNNIQKIGNYAFNSNQLTSIELPNELVTIENYAFSYNKIENIQFGNNLEKIGDSAFIGNKIKNLEIPTNIKIIGERAFQYNKIETLILQNGIEEIAREAFAQNKINQLNLPNTLKKLGSGAFTNNQLSDENAFIYNRKLDESTNTYTSNYEELNSYAGANRDNVVIPNEVTSIDEYAFYDCDIKKVKLPSSLKSIGMSAFFENELTSVDLPYGINTIGGYAFYHNKLTSIDLPYGINTIGGYAFANNKLTFVVVPDSLTQIGNSIFNENDFEGENSFIYTKNENNRIDYTTLAGYYNKSYEVDELVIPNTVKTIKSNAFSNISINKLIIPYGVEEIGDYAFREATIKETSIPKSVNKIGVGVFSTNYNLSENKDKDFVYARNEDGTIDKTILMGYNGYLNDGKLILPEGIVEIRENVFYNKYNLNEVILPSTLKKIGNSAFEYSYQLNKVTFNDGLETIGNNAFYLTNLTNINLGNNLQSIGENAFANNYNLVTVNIGDSSVDIGANAFINNPNTTSVTLGNNIKSIGDYAFYNNNIGEINIPGTVKTIGDYAFYLNNLTHITLNEGLENIGDYAFYENGNIKNITIPRSVTEIGDGAFNWNIENVNILGKESANDFNYLGNNSFGYNATVIYELFEPKLELPTTPITIYKYDSSYNIIRTYEITNITYMFVENSNKTYNLKMLISGNKTSDDLGNENKDTVDTTFHLLRESDGNTHEMKNQSLPGIQVGDSFTDYEIIFYNLPRDNFRLELFSQN